MDDSRVHWVAGSHSGRPAVPRNRGMAVARGEWLAFLDSDDEWLPGKLAAQLAALRRSGRLASSTNAWRVVAGARQSIPLLAEPGQLAGFPKLLAGNIVVCSSAVIHRSLVAVVEGFPETAVKVPEDYGLWLRISTLTEFDYLAEPLVLYRDQPADSIRAHDLDGRTKGQVLVDFSGGAAVIHRCEGYGHLSPRDGIATITSSGGTERSHSTSRPMLLGIDLAAAPWTLLSEK